MNPMKKQFLEADSLDKVVGLFTSLGFNKSEENDGCINIEINDDTDFISVYIREGNTQQIDSIAKKYVSGRKAVVEVSPDFSSWVFGRVGFEEKQRVLKYRIIRDKVRKEENPVSIQRLASLEYNNHQAWDALFERKDISKKFYQEFKKKRLSIIKQIEGIPDEEQGKKSWYATVLLNRIVFLYFLQQKGILNRNERYLNEKFQEFHRSGKPFFTRFLRVLFFDTLCKEKAGRDKKTIEITGEHIPYLNGGLFLEHELESAYPKLNIPNQAFQDLFAFFESWFWNPSEREVGEGDQIDPYILGYIFEQSLGETKGDVKAGGVYYTPPNLAVFLTKETIQSHLKNKMPFLKDRPTKEDIEETMASLQEDELIELFQNLIHLRILDPASGSGQFLVEALHELTQFHEKILEIAKKENLQNLLALMSKTFGLNEPQKIDLYAIRGYIVSENLHGVDLLNEAVEITKLRLFLGMIENIEEEVKEPLPNIDFNIQQGNSLVGFLKLPRFDGKRQDTDIFSPLDKNLEERYRLIEEYRHTKDPDEVLRLRKKIKKEEDLIKKELSARFNRKAREEWKLKPKKKIDFIDMKEEDKKYKQKLDRYEFKAEEHEALHWELTFWEVMHTDPKTQSSRGFDIVLTNPPWEVWKPNSQEFFENHIKDFRQYNKPQARQKVVDLLKKDKNIKEKWVGYNLKISATASYFRLSGLYSDQGRGDISLQKLFLERCFHILNQNGTLGCVIPSGLYSDNGSTELRRLFFRKSGVGFLYGFENRKKLFENVDSRFKFILFSATKSDTPSETIPSAFMMHTQADLLDAHARKKGSRFVNIPVSLIPKVSGEILALMEFKNQKELERVSKIYAKHPLLGEELEGAWNVSLKTEFHTTNDSHLFIEKEKLQKLNCTYDPKTLSWQDKRGGKYLPLYEGKMIWQYDGRYKEPRYWLEESEGRKSLSGKTSDKGQTLPNTHKSGKTKDTARILPYQKPRLCFRKVASNTNERTWVMALLPANVFLGDSLNYLIPNDGFNEAATLSFLGIANSFMMDFILRLKVTNNVNIFYTKSLPIIRQSQSPLYGRLAERVSALLEVGRLTDNPEAQELKNQIDAMVAKIYGLNLNDLKYILSTFPLVDQAVKEDILKEFEAVEGV